MTRKRVHLGSYSVPVLREIYDYWAICACVKYFDVKYFAWDRVRVRVRVINFADVINFATA